MRRGRHTVALAAAIGTTLTTALAVLVAPAPAGAADTGHTPDVAHLPAGAAPQLPYVDRRTERIVDGDRRVSIAGLRGTVVRLFKVDGGYLLGRSFDGGQDLVVVRRNGARSVLVDRWRGPGIRTLDNRLAISHDGSRVVLNTASVEHPFDYRATEVRTLPEGTLVRRRVFDVVPSLLAYGTQRVLATSYPDSLWWTVSTNAVDRFSPGVRGEVADLTAWQWFTRGGATAYRFSAIPPRTTPDWDQSHEDWLYGPWSTDDAYVAGHNEQDDVGISSAYLVNRTSDGALVASFSVEAVADVTWETASRVLLHVRLPDRRYQWIRCAVPAGNCSRVGPATSTTYGALVPAMRRNS